MVGFVAFTTATGKPKKDTPKPTSFPDPTPTQTAPFVTPAPNDIEPLLLAASLDCASKPTNVGCKLLKEFEMFKNAGIPSSFT